MKRGETSYLRPGQVWDGYRWVTEAEFKAAQERSKLLKESK